jgi:hypothetical protein
MFRINSFDGEAKITNFKEVIHTGTLQQNWSQSAVLKMASSYWAWLVLI